MRAAVVTSFERAPALADFPEPEVGPNELLVRVEAAALSQLARGQASGRHYGSSGALPFVPGVDAVGQLAGGERVYVAFPRAPWGTMGEVTVVDRRHVVPLPDTWDSVTFAAIANPAMSSWAALTGRAAFARGESVLINGAAGVAGRLAIRIAKWLGAKRIIATARDAAARTDLMALGADVFISLGQAPHHIVAEVQRELEQDVHVVLDYLWGSPAEWILQAILSHAKAATPYRVRFVNIGSMAGPSASLSASVLRSSRVELVGSGLGSLPTETLVKSVAAFASAMKGERLAIDAMAVPIDAVHEQWRANSDKRLVFTFSSAAKSAFDGLTSSSCGSHS